MSSTVSQESRVMLAELLAAEKDDTREWLRSEMDGLVDSMFHRLTNKLMMNSHLEQTQSDDDSQMVHHDAQLEPNQLHQSSFVIGQPSTSSHLIPPHQNVHYSYQQPNDPIHSNDNSNQQSQLMISLIQPISPNVNFEVPISNEPTTTNQVNHSLPTESQSAIANEQQYNTNFDDADNEGECDCEDCLNAIEIDEVVEDDDDDSDSVQWIDDDQEEDESSRPVKRPRLDSTQPNNATQPEVTNLSPRQPTDEAQPNQVNNHDKQYITVHLQCPLSECPDKFTEDQLTQHMFDVHSMGSFRCPVKDCAQAFDDIAILKKHRKQSHQSTTQWHCDKCLKHFAKYKRLSDHNHLYHQLGHFQCSFPACTFVGEFRMKMYDHYRQQHKPEFVCSQTDCNYRTYNESTLKAHERAHLGIKPYRCKWLNCHHSSSYQHHVLFHIRTQHLTSRFKRPNQMDVVAQSADPRDYLEVASELL